MLFFKKKTKILLCGCIQKIWYQSLLSFGFDTRKFDSLLATYIGAHKFMKEFPFLMKSPDPMLQLLLLHETI